jgi:predicted ABC-type ATPase
VLLDPDVIARELNPNEPAKAAIQAATNFAFRNKKWFFVVGSSTCFILGKTRVLKSKYAQAISSSALE